MPITLSAPPTSAATAIPAMTVRVEVLRGPDTAAVDHLLPIDEEFTGALPPARRVLAVGCAHAALGARYERTYPGAVWRELDHVDALFGDDATPEHDLLVLGDGLPADRDPWVLFEALARWAAPDANLVLQFDQGATLAALERVIEGDFGDDGSGAGRRSVSSIYKRLMDAGWMPTLAGHRPAPTATQGIASAALAMADMLNIPRGSARRTLSMAQVVVRARRVFDTPPAAGAALFTAVVPTTRTRQLRLNVEASPGLKEVGARIVTCRHAAHPAEALEASLGACETDWVLLCHQDVYFPHGFGAGLNAVLAAIPADERERTLIGFVGMGVNTQTHGYEPAGFVIDRLEAASHAASDHAVSMDELAIVVARRSLHRIDPALGWHLWATDLCLASICEHRVFPRIVRLPLFHNSVTDYALPEGFHASAAVLARKHAGFGPIPTLCTTIDEAFLKTRVPRPPGTAGTTDTPGPPPAAPPSHAGAAFDLVVQPDTREAAALIEAGDFEGATAALCRGVHLSYTQPEVKHRKLYYPAFDQQLVQLAQALGREPGEARSGAPGVPLIIATELYDLGGHSRVLEEISREMKQPVLLLTDLFRTGHHDPAQLERLRQRFPHVQLIVLPDAPLWEKCRMLRTLDLRLKPRSTLYFGHHQDPIPFIGTLAQPGRKRLFFHHGDHNPSLGCTLPGVEHVDLIGNLQTLCSERLDHPTHRLPLYIADQGVKHFAAVSGRGYSVVTSGHPAKFSRTGAVALQDIVAAALQAVEGRFFHIGPLDDAWVSEIRAHLGGLALDPSRFVPLGLVPSVWGTLKSIDAAVYIGSAPVSGGRAGIEAQGCGYPVLCFKGFDAGSLLADYSSYADPAIGWSDPAELRALLGTVGDRHRQLSRAARDFYDAEFSHKRFRKLLRGLLGH